MALFFLTLASSIAVEAQTPSTRMLTIRPPFGAASVMTVPALSASNVVAASISTAILSPQTQAPTTQSTSYLTMTTYNTHTTTLPVEQNESGELVVDSHGGRQEDVTPTSTSDWWASMTNIASSAMSSMTLRPGMSSSSSIAPIVRTTTVTTGNTVYEDVTITIEATPSSSVTAATMEARNVVDLTGRYAIISTEGTNTIYWDYDAQTSFATRPVITPPPALAHGKRAPQADHMYICTVIPSKPLSCNEYKAPATNLPGNPGVVYRFCVFHDSLTNYECGPSFMITNAGPVSPTIGGDGLPFVAGPPQTPKPSSPPPPPAPTTRPAQPTPPTPTPATPPPPPQTLTTTQPAAPPPPPQTVTQTQAAPPPPPAQTITVTSQAPISEPPKPTTMTMVTTQQAPSPSTSVVIQPITHTIFTTEQPPKPSSASTSSTSTRSSTAFSSLTSEKLDIESSTSPPSSSSSITSPKSSSSTFSSSSRASSSSSSSSPSSSVVISSSFFSSASVASSSGFVTSVITSSSAVETKTCIDRSAWAWWKDTELYTGYECVAHASSGAEIRRYRVASQNDLLGNWRTLAWTTACIWLALWLVT